MVFDLVLLFVLSCSCFVVIADGCRGGGRVGASVVVAVVVLLLLLLFLV